MSLFAADGSINVTVVDGTTFTGLYSPAGGWNVIEASGSTPQGLYHACGALRVTVVASGLTAAYAADGSLNVVVTPYEASGPARVTVVSGAFA